ncbi:ATP-binding protein [Liquorilactobacillus hordei]|uniref:Uncharacterized protein n=1 Tax=Liquorilactobacillus hordei DSM 19519 TaxID=1423759 RepID=A0A0R1MUK1_9LACO|nr:ATP-binding protein [Liquorilactobacillus hordei]KRL07995.1 hypothetical protein FC92_GL001066 [Liquorilactobacillus hordei DSM 19519]QYH51061.1 ATP-binding protein [Liquorilactobacillus hordei DSM 19519]
MVTLGDILQDTEMIIGDRGSGKTSTLIRKVINYSKTHGGIIVLTHSNIALNSFNNEFRKALGKYQNNRIGKDGIKILNSKTDLIFQHEVADGSNIFIDEIDRFNAHFLYALLNLIIEERIKLIGYTLTPTNKSVILLDNYKGKEYIQLEYRVLVPHTEDIYYYKDVLNPAILGLAEEDEIMRLEAKFPNRYSRTFTEDDIGRFHLSSDIYQKKLISK